MKEICSLYSSVCSLTEEGLEQPLPYFQKIFEDCGIE